MSSATNSVTGGSFPNTPQKPDDVSNDGLDDARATIAEAQASFTFRSMPVHADSCARHPHH